MKRIVLTVAASLLLAPTAAAENTVRTENYIRDQTPISQGFT